MSEQERNEPEQESPEGEETLGDLDVPEEHGKDVTGGSYDIKKV